LRLGPTEELKVSVGRQPLPTVLSLLADALGAAVQGVPPGWRAAARAACPSAAAQVLVPVCERKGLWLPDCLSPLPLDTDSVPAQLDRMATVPSDQLAGEVGERFPDGVPPGWQRAIERPALFVHGYVNALAGVWSAFAPVWRQSRHLLELEAERIGIATVTGTLDSALALLGPRVRRTREGLSLPGRGAGHDTRELPHGRLLLVPLVSGTTASVLGLDGRGPSWIGYPVPGLRELASGTAVVKHRAMDPLEAVLGGMRARVMRLAHLGPTMGEISSLLHCAPGATTHHCKLLEAAGLVRRRRQGQQVRLLLTRRGERLLGVLAS
jgi:DNA-binding transcriptional ArsR family regulator